MFEDVGDATLKRYLEDCAKASALDPYLAFKITKEHVRAFNQKTQIPKPIKKLQDRWYSSLKAEPDYSVYGDPIYFCDLWLCWVKYSRRYLKDIQKPNMVASRSVAADIAPKVVLDVGCGVGYTSAVLKKIFPRAQVLGTNIRGTSQFRMASSIGKRHGFKVVGSFRGIKADLVFASEYFEHWQEPIHHLNELLQSCRPKHLLIANAFGSPSIGHFPLYKHLGSEYDGRQISRLFNNALRNHGYERVKTKLWNGRPAYWRKVG